jgi:8-oxo-dGTP diphosphatase
METKVGISSFIVKDSQYILLGKRKGSHGEGEWATPGGGMEYGETVMETFDREVLEECGSDLVVDYKSVMATGDLLTYMPKHYVDICVFARYVSGSPAVVEPDKVESWEWHDIHNLPTPVFASIPHLVAIYKNGYSTHWTCR